MKCKQHSVVESYATWCMSVFWGGGGDISRAKVLTFAGGDSKKMGGGGGEDIIMLYTVPCLELVHSLY